MRNRNHNKSSKHAAALRRKRPCEASPRVCISLCMIVRDEEEFIAGCLQSAAGVADEIVVLDTGSVDRTAEIARAHGARVYDHRWQDSYSEARNAAIDLATGDWILVLDADERLDAHAGPIIRKAVRGGCFTAYEFIQRNYYSDDETSDVIVSPTCRLWRNLPGYRYQGRIHENPAPSIVRSGGAIGRLDVVIHHYGNQPRVLAGRDKCRRYIRLLETELRDNPNDVSKLHDIAVSYYVIGRYDDALPYLERAIGLLTPNSPIAGMVYSTYVGALVHSGRYEQAVTAMERASSLGIRHPEICYAAGQALMALERYEAAAAEFESAIELGKQGEWIGDKAVWGHKAHEAASMCLLKLGRWTEAARHGSAALQFKPDRAETRAVVAQACLSWGDELYRAADYPTAAELYSSALSLVPDHAQGFFALGNCYLRMGAVESAIMAYRRALAIRPNYAEARNNLSIAEEALGIDG